MIQLQYIIDATDTNIYAILMSAPDSKDSCWMILIHQIPPKPSYLRVKISRRLQRIGAVAIKNTVYALPKGDSAQEDFQWVLREIVSGGGDATICEAHFVDGLCDADMEDLFRKARDAEYQKIVEKAEKLLKTLPRAASHDEHGNQVEADLGRLKRQMNALTSIDFFGAPGRMDAERAVAAVEERLQPKVKAADLHTLRPEEYRGRTWVTRKGIHVDRMASAWLIRRFIDSKAKFKFVPGKGYIPNTGEVRFDMFEGEFTHEGDRCTFEVLVERMGLDDPALRPIAEIVHDIDLKDGKFERGETEGVDRVVTGIAVACKADEDRLARAITMFDGLYESFRRKSR